ncbi:hypothetical protein GCK32_014477 [Trichostrongylus colubriformis]|uniref:DOMON domain-containing protein n=1 Tax=Trichostrongylus colubriformis TaxID=6319 RepID=A0AAN8FX43_TRICO
MTHLLLTWALVLLSPCNIYSAGKCDLSVPPESWLVTTATGISKWGTAGVSDNGNQFCINGSPSTVIEVDYHADLPEKTPRNAHQLTRSALNLWDNPDNMCVMDDPQIHVCIPFCANEPQPMIIQAALSSGNPQIVADSIAKSMNFKWNKHWEDTNANWAITVLQVDFNNPAAHLNVSMFADPAVWCSVYIGIDPQLGFPYLYEIQLVKVNRFMSPKRNRSRSQADNGPTSSGHSSYKIVLLSKDRPTSAAPVESISKASSGLVDKMLLVYFILMGAFCAKHLIFRSKPQTV